MSFGRPRLLDEVKQKEFCALVAVGFNVNAAAANMGISAQTVRREQRLNPQFEEAVIDALRTASITPLLTIQQEAKSNWRAAAWLLERTRPEDFGKVPASCIRSCDLVELTESIIAEFLKLVPDEALRDKMWKLFNSLIEQQMRAIRAGNLPQRKPTKEKKPPPKFDPYKKCRATELTEEMVEENRRLGREGDLKRRQAEAEKAAREAAERAAAAEKCKVQHENCTMVERECGAGTNVSSPVHPLTPSPVHSPHRAGDSPAPTSPHRAGDSPAPTRQYLVPGGTVYYDPTFDWRKKAREAFLAHAESEKHRENGPFASSGPESKVIKSDRNDQKSPGDSP